MTTIYVYLNFYFWRIIYIQKPRNSVQHVSIAKVSFCDFFSLHPYHMGVHQIWATRKDGTIGTFILFHVNWKRKGLATAFGHSRSFTAALIGGKLDFPVFLRSERRKTGNCSFTAALIGGKLDFPVFLRSERRKTGNSSFTAATIGGKGDFPVFLLSEGRKTANCMWRKSFNPIFYPFFPSFACWWVVGRGLAPQNEGWTCVNNNWEK